MKKGCTQNLTMVGFRGTAFSCSYLVRNMKYRANLFCLFSLILTELFVSMFKVTRNFR